MARGKTAKMGTNKGTSNHDLSDLVGKKIKSITLQEVNVTGDGTNIRQFYRITCAGADGAEFVLACDGGHEDSQYATATLMDPEDFETFLEDVQSEDSEDSEYDEEDSYDEDSDEDEDEVLEDDGYDEDADL